MPLTYLEHVNIRTAALAPMARFYEDVVGLKNGYRPPFRVAGAWLYCGDRPSVHLVQVAEPRRDDSPKIEHFAFRAEGFREFIARLEAHNVAYEIAHVVDIDLCQVNIHDPDGNLIEIGFGPAEKTDFAPYIAGAKSIMADTEA